MAGCWRDSWFLLRTLLSRKQSPAITTHKFFDNFFAIAGLSSINAAPQLAQQASSGMPQWQQI
jgi:hypothetical protein